MKYNNQLPDSSVNVTKTNSLLEMVKLLFVLIVFALLFYTALKYTIYYIVDNMPITYEKKLTKLVTTDMGIKNPKTDEYLDEVTKKIASCAKLPYDIQTYIIKDKNPNAFALPGGSIYITEGMLKTIKTQNELVSVIGHEMGHFKHKDHLKSMGVKLIFSILSLTLGEGYGTILNTTLDVSNIKYSQLAEYEADKFSLDVVSCAYGNVAGATDLFKRMDDGEDWSYFLETHPSFNNRIHKMDEHIIEMGYNTKAKLIPLKKKF